MYRKRGKRRTLKRFRYKGGLAGLDPRYTLLPQSIVNIGRDSLAQTQNLMNAGKAYPPVVSPSVMNQPINK